MNFAHFFKCSRKAIKCYDETGSHEYCHRKGIPRLTSAPEDTFLRVLTAPQIEAWINASQSSSNRHISASTVQRRLRESGLHGWIAAKKPLLKDTNKKKSLAWSKKHKQWTLDQWKSVLWSDEFKCKISGFTCRVFVRRRVGERMISACVVPTMKHGGGGVIVLWCFAGDTVCDLFRNQGTLNQHGYHSILQCYAIPSGLRLVGL